MLRVAALYKDTLLRTAAATDFAAYGGYLHAYADTCRSSSQR